MRKSILYLMMMVLSLNFIPTPMMASEKEPIALTHDPNEIPPDIKAQLARLDEINQMDKSTLTRSQKRALRKEVKAINTSLKSKQSGFFLTLGALIIILILLIVLLK